MRIVPVMNVFNKGHNVKNCCATRFESKGNYTRMPSMNYTGEASVDLAYASMYDEAIARDLKLMGLI